MLRIISIILFIFPVIAANAYEQDFQLDGNFIIEGKIH